MMPFRHAGDEWEVAPGQAGSGAGIGGLPDITTWDVRFVCTTNPGRSCTGYMGKRIVEASSEDFTAALERALIISALEDTQGTPRSLTLQELTERTKLTLAEARNRAHRMPRYVYIFTANGEEQYRAM
jgi:hypothetical protein